MFFVMLEPHRAFIISHLYFLYKCVKIITTIYLIIFLIATFVRFGAVQKLRNAYFYRLSTQFPLNPLP